MYIVYLFWWSTDDLILKILRDTLILQTFSLNLSAAAYFKKAGLLSEKKFFMQLFYLGEISFVLYFFIFIPFLTFYFSFFRLYIISVDANCLNFCSHGTRL